MLHTSYIHTHACICAHIMVDCGEGIAFSQYHGVQYTGISFPNIHRFFSFFSFFFPLRFVLCTHKFFLATVNSDPGWINYGMFTHAQTHTQGRASLLCTEQFPRWGEGEAVVSCF